MLDKQEIINKYARSEKDTGSSEVQIAILTSRIERLSKHMQANRGDKHSNRGLLLMVSQRKKLLSYLSSKNSEAYKGIISSLGLRK